MDRDTYAYQQNSCKLYYRTLTLYTRSTKSLVKTAPIQLKLTGLPKTVEALSKHLEAGQNGQSLALTIRLKPISNSLNQVKSAMTQL